MSANGGVIVWEWKHDGGQWLPYDSDVSNSIETQNVLLSNSANHRPQRKANPIGVGQPNHTVDLSRFGSALQNLTVDLNAMTQRNTRSGTVRRIRRTEYHNSSPIASGVVWQWLDDNGSDWRFYSAEVSALLEKARISNASAVDLNRNPFYLPYVVRLSSMQQIRNGTNFIRPVRRLVLQRPYERSSRGQVTGPQGASNNWQHKPNPVATPGVGSGLAAHQNGSNSTPALFNVGRAPSAAAGSAAAMKPKRERKLVRDLTPRTPMSSFPQPSAAPSTSWGHPNTGNQQQLSVMYPSQTSWLNPFGLVSSFSSLFGQASAVAGSFVNWRSPGNSTTASSTQSTAPLYHQNSTAGQQTSVAASASWSDTVKSLTSKVTSLVSSISLKRKQSDDGSGDDSDDSHHNSNSKQNFARPSKSKRARPNHVQLSHDFISVLQSDGSGGSVTADSILRQFAVYVVVPPAKEDCCICCDALTEPSGYGGCEEHVVVKLEKCGHMYHKDCISAMFNSGTKDGGLQCPTCKKIYGIKRGNCPLGEMRYRRIPSSLAGYEHYETIEIVYNIRNGTQNGQRYTAIAFPRYGYLPDNDKGRHVLELLIKAWQRRLTFTIGTSVTSGQKNVVVWNEIHHKTSPTNHSGHGYPDPNYLDNVLAELTAHGVVED